MSASSSLDRQDASVAAPILLVGLLVVVSLVWRRATLPHGPVAVAAAARVEVPGTDAARVLLGRWRDRARRWRAIATLPAVVASVVVSIAATGQLTIGLVDTVGRQPVWSDPLVVGLLALAFGAFGAELHHLRPTTDEPRSASLVPREVVAVRRPGALRRRALLGVLAGLVILGHGVAVWREVIPAGVPWAAIVAAGVLAAAAGVERRIAARPRPTLPPDLAQADAAVRRVAARSVDDAAAGASILLLGWAGLGTIGAQPASGPAAPLLDAGALLVPLTALVAAVWWAWRSSPRRLLRESAAVGGRA